MTSPEFSYASSELDSLRDARNYYGMLIDRFRGFFGDRIVEIGAGVGNFADYLLRESAGSFVLVEPATNHIALLEERFAGDSRVKVVHGYLETLPTEIAGDTFVMVNVLEHIEDDEGTLASIHQRLSAGGALLLFVPAVPQIYGSLDREFAHFRRYTKPDLKRKLIGAGFDIERLDYVNFPGVLSWFIAGRVLRKKTLEIRDVQLYDRFVVPWVNALERRWKPPIGQSLLAIAIKRSSPTG